MAASLAAAAAGADTRLGTSAAAAGRLHIACAGTGGTEGAGGVTVAVSEAGAGANPVAEAVATPGNIAAAALSRVGGTAEGPGVCALSGSTALGP
eukprot:scaffold23175_cov115-Isochrysis_galbana.AAC.7